MTAAKDEWLEGVVVSNTHWTQNLFSLRIQADLAPYVAGQYTSLGLTLNDERISQPYSILSAPQAQPVEFFFYTNLEGQLSAELARLQPGDTVWVLDRPEGRFTLEQVPNGDDLWLLATGTGVAPFLSILQTAEPWKRFKRVVLVYAVRQEADLAYRELIKGLQQRHPDNFVFVPVISREMVVDTINGHIPACIADGTLEQTTNIPLSQHSQFMLCGNPGMVQDATTALQDRGFTRSSNGSGNITIESYW